MGSHFGRNKKRALIQQVAALQAELENEKLKVFGDHGRCDLDLIHIEKLPLVIMSVETIESIGRYSLHNEKRIILDAVVDDGFRQTSFDEMHQYGAIFRGHRVIVDRVEVNKNEKLGGFSFRAIPNTVTFNMIVVRGETFYKKEDK